MQPHACVAAEKSGEVCVARPCSRNSAKSVALLGCEQAWGFHSRGLLFYVQYMCSSRGLHRTMLAVSSYLHRTGS